MPPQTQPQRLTVRRRLILYFAVIVLAIAASFVTMLLSYMRESVNRSICAAYLHHLSESIRVYQREHDGARPDSLPTLIRYAGIESGDGLLCPSTDEQPLPHGSEELAAAIEHGRPISYIYVRPDAAHPSEIWIYERPGNHRGGRHVLKADGTIWWLSAAEESPATKP